MRAVVQRVRRAAVLVGDETTGRIDLGLLVLLGVARGDPPDAEALLARKVAQLRVFPDDGGKMNRDVTEAGGAVLVVSQFTLLASCRRGRRPSFVEAAPPEEAARRYEAFCALLRAEHGLRVETGRFAAAMEVELVNWGPVTIPLDTVELGLPLIPGGDARGPCVADAGGGGEAEAPAGAGPAREPGA